MIIKLNDGKNWTFSWLFKFLGAPGPKTHICKLSLNFFDSLDLLMLMGISEYHFDVLDLLRKVMEL